MNEVLITHNCDQKLLYYVQNFYPKTQGNSTQHPFMPFRNCRATEVSSLRTRGGGLASPIVQSCDFPCTLNVAIYCHIPIPTSTLLAVSPTITMRKVGRGWVGIQHHVCKVQYCSHILGTHNVIAERLSVRQLIQLCISFCMCMYVCLVPQKMHTVVEVSVKVACRYHIPMFKQA